MSIKKIRNGISALMSGRRKVYTAIVASMLVFCLLTSFVVMRINTVTIFEEGKEVASFTTFENDKDQLLAAAGLDVSNSDIVEHTTDGRNITIKVTHAFCVFVKTADEQVTVQTIGGKTVADILEQAGVEYDESDKISPELTKAVTAYMEITVIRSPHDALLIRFEEERNYFSLLKDKLSQWSL